MVVFKQILVAAFALLLALGAPAARPLSDDESSSLAATVAAFDAAMRNSDYATVVKTIPPRIMEHIAKQAGVEVDALREIVMAQMKATLAEVKLLSFGMDLAKAQRRELTGGEPYVLIPTETVMDAGTGGKFKAKSDTLALLDAGTWYLLRVNEAEQVTIMRQVYPEFADIEFSAGTMEPLE
jgi:hypothetical protein